MKRTSQKTVKQNQNFKSNLSIQKTSISAETSLKKLTVFATSSGVGDHFVESDTDVCEVPKTTIKRNKNTDRASKSSNPVPASVKTNINRKTNTTEKQFEDVVVANPLKKTPKKTAQSKVSTTCKSTSAGAPYQTWCAVHGDQIPKTSKQSNQSFEPIVLVGGMTYVGGRN